MSSQSAPDTGKLKTSPGWLQRMAANLGFTNALSLRETLESAIRETGAEEDESLSLQERAMLLNVLGFGETRVSEVMKPRADMVAIEEGEPVAALFKIFAEAGHSRVPVFRDSLDNPIGMVHIKDAVIWAIQNSQPSEALKQANGAPLPAFGDEALRATIAEAKLVREVLFVPPSMRGLTLLAKMKATKIHLALVVDEFGGTDGLVTFGDLVEAIVGDIDDEHDTEKSLFMGFEGEAFVASARTPIEDIEQVLGITLAIDEAADVDTIGGLLMALAGSMPKRGQTIHHPSGVTFEILEAGPRRLHTVRILKPLALPPAETPLMLPAPDKNRDLQDNRSHGNGAGAKAA
jgi:CBS domain containing-hemolysin-like protein